MGLAKVLLGRSKESGLAKCARVDSLGLARRRLAAKHEAAHKTEEPVEEPSPAEPAADATTLRRAALPNGLDPQIPTDQEDEATVPFGHRQLTDSLRLARRRFQHRASLDLHPHSPCAYAAQRSTYSSSATQRPACGGRTHHHHTSSHHQHHGGAASGPDDELDGVASPHVRFRRASDGEYLGRQSRKSFEASIPNALRAVQLKAERLFRRLTGVPEPNSRPRSASRGHSPPSGHHNRTSGPRGAAAPAWAHTVQRRRTSDSGSGADDSPPPRSSQSAAAGRERRKRQSAPGELLLNSADAGDGADGGSPPLVPAAARPKSAVYTGGGGAGGKSRNWLVRLSRGLNGASSHASPQPRQHLPPIQHESPEGPAATQSAVSPGAAAAAPPPPLPPLVLVLPVAASDIEVAPASPGPLAAAAPASPPQQQRHSRGSAGADERQRCYAPEEGRRSGAFGERPALQETACSGGTSGGGEPGPIAHAAADASPSHAAGADVVGALAELALMSVSVAGSAAEAAADECSRLPGTSAAAPPPEPAAPA